MSDLSRHDDPALWRAVATASAREARIWERCAAVFMILGIGLATLDHGWRGMLAALATTLAVCWLAHKERPEDPESNPLSKVLFAGFFTAAVLGTSLFWAAVAGLLLWGWWLLVNWAFHNV